MTLDAERILINQIAEHFQIEKYTRLISCVIDKSFDVSKNIDFQTDYDGFWNLRRNEKWRKEYFKYFQELRTGIIKGNSVPEFRTILENVSEINKKLDSRYSFEPSFSSKMLATIDPNKPIWDSRVLEKLGYKNDWERDKSIDKADEIYKRICGWYAENVETAEMRRNIEIFDSYLPEYKNRISTVKKIDYLLWGM